MYDFDKAAERQGTNCVKWDVCDKAFGGENLLPMWIADMDFKAAPGIIKHLEKKLSEAVFGYNTFPEEYYEAVISWMQRRHHYDVQKEWLCFTPGVVTALNYGVQALTEPGDEVMVLTPVYNPFFSSIEGYGRVAVRVPLHNEDGYYTMDFEKMEEMVSEKTKAILFCSPHNPVGRVWNQEELEQLVEFCVKHNLYIIDDEIHNDLVYGKEHIMLGRISKEVEKRAIICTAPSKSFNIAGLQASNIIIPDEEIRNKFKAVMSRDHAGSPNSFAAEAVIGAYNESEEWLDELIVYLKGNAEFFADYVEQHIPKLKVHKPEGTYLAWIDCSGLGFADEEQLKKFFVEKCGLALNWGGVYGEQCKQYMRINLACPKAYVEKAVKQIEKAVNEL